MIVDYSINSYIELLRTHILSCYSIEENDANLPYKLANEQICIICRSRSDVDTNLFKDTPEAGTSIDLNRDGQADLYIRIRKYGRYQIEIQKYRLAIFGIPDNNNRILSMRYDYTGNIHEEQIKLAWDNELNDNPQHPMSHLHVNFLLDNNCRLAVGQVSPILALKAFDHWYYETFIKH
jgi:hypothetical protein